MKLIGGDAALQDNGDIVAAGCTDKGFATVRLLPDGSIDPSFSEDGFAHTTFGVQLTGVHGGDTVSGVAMDGNDIVVAGDADSHHWALARYLPDGTRDSTFGDNGKVITSFSGISTDVLVQPDGKIVVCGFNSGSVVVLRYLPDGSHDPGFGSNGKAIVPLGPSGNNAPSRMVLGTDGTILVAGFSFNGLSGVLRLTEAGELDDTFGHGGVTTTSSERGTRPTRSASLCRTTGRSSPPAAACPRPKRSPLWLAICRTALRIRPSATTAR
jgi:uncharacterized delta-60 repeat protein